jgi:sporulation protein YlmC with PRC-barrel domain
MKETDVVKATHVVGSKVIDIDNNRLGKIEEIIINKHSGKINYVIIGHGSFFGIGGDFFALPWNSLYFEPAMNCYVANANKEDCSKIDDIDDLEWSEDKKWEHAVSNYFACFAL